MPTISELLTQAVAHHQAGDFQGAEGLFRQALQSAGEHAAGTSLRVEAHFGLGNVYLELGRLPEASVQFRQTIALQPSMDQAHNNLGIALMRQGKREEAVASYRQALALRPENAEAHNNLGAALAEGGAPDQAIIHYRQALKLQPDNADAHNNLGNVLMDQGRLAEAQALFQRALRLKPGSATTLSNWLFALNLDVQADPVARFTEHCRWGRLHRHPAPLPAHGNDPNPERRLRIGYVSPDLFRHPVAQFFAPLLANHDPTRVEVFCYADVRAPDAVTAQLQACCHGWRWTCGLSDAEVAEQVRADGIDILVDLAGHTANNRLKVFAQKPAPVQVTYLGYPDTTGLTTIDYRLTDAVLDPPGGLPWHTEELIRLPGGMCRFAPPDHAPAVNPLPALRNPYVTFGSLNRLEKLNDRVIDLWCRVLDAVSSSRLLLFRHNLTGETQERLLQQFAGRGVPAERLDLRHAPDARGHLGVYGDIDLCLDVFPWTGHVTTCEALWMGVPVVTLAGARGAARLSASVLTCLGWTDPIADTPEQYVTRAVQLAHDRQRLQQWRSGLREKMRATLCDAKDFTRDLEKIYRAMWRRWCGGQSQPTETQPEERNVPARARAVIPSPAARLFAQASACQRAGNLQPAASFCLQALQADAKHADAWHLLGVIAYQLGHNDRAIEALAQAAALDGSNALFHSNLAEVYRTAKRLDEAVASGRRAVLLQAGLPEAHNNLGMALMDQGRSAEAADAYREAIRCRPSYPDAHNNLGNALQAQGQLSEAEACYREALRIQPDYVLVLNNLGNVLKEQRKFDEASARCQEALRLEPGNAEARRCLGHVFLQQGKLPEAEECFRQVLKTLPDSVAAHRDLGDVLTARLQLAEAIESYRQALRLAPDNAETHCNLGKALLDHGRLKEAIASFREALRLKPDYALAHTNLLFSLNNDAELEPARLFAEHRNWEAAHAQGILPPVHVHSPDPERRLRIGYVSPDFRRHAVARFFEPILAHHDSNRFDIFCYASVAAPDDVTARIKDQAQCWRAIHDLSDERAANLIQADGIDVLVDLAGHASGHRLGVFVRRPAPVQVTYLGYPNTTGLTAIDYKITDAVLDPPGDRVLHTEELVRLPSGVCCIAPPENVPEVAPLPALRTGRVTFGSLHRLSKLNSLVLDLWSRILKDVPDSRLLLFWHTLRGEVKDYFQRQFLERGVPAEKLELRQASTVRGYQKIYEEIDILLDVFPWSGGTTTCDALWMGVPVLTLYGDRHAARMSSTLLTRVGLTDLIARTPDEYVVRARELAGNREQLSNLRGRLRQRMAGTLCDGKRVATDLQEAYRAMWRKWCAGRRSPAPPTVPALAVPAATDLFEQASRCHRAGNSEQAEKLLREVIRVDANHANAWNMLGILAYQAGQYEQALEALAKAVARDGSNALIHSNMAEIYRTLKRAGEAVVSARQAVRLQPDLPEAHHNLGLALVDEGRHEEAAASCREAIRCRPDYADAHNSLGNILQALGKSTEAEDCYRQALRSQPDFVYALQNLGNVLLEQKNLEEAAQFYQRALQLHPGCLQAHLSLGRIHLSQNRLAEAKTNYQQALHFQPDNISAYNGLGNVAMKQYLVREAEAYYHEALRLQPNDAESNFNLGNVIIFQEKYAEAIAYYRKAVTHQPNLICAYIYLSVALAYLKQFDEALSTIQEALRLKPESAEAINCQGQILFMQGKIAEAEARFREALRIQPRYPLAHQNLLFLLNYVPHLEPAALFDEHRRWGEMYGPTTTPPPPGNNPDPERRLRVGYVSPDLRTHSVAYFIEPILVHHDSARVETFCYAEVRKPDSLTARLRQSTHNWRWTFHLSDDRLAQQIQDDHIDILVDLAGHTLNNRLRVFALKPAPVQVTYLGYPNTTGLTTVDYRLTDDIADPPGEPPLHTEELVRLPGGFCCYQPPSDAPPVAPLPALTADRFTFGGIHGLNKLNGAVLDLWCAILRALPSSRLILFRDSLTGTIAELLQRQFADRGIGSDRVQLLAAAPGGRILNLYADMDLFLDTFPWGGHTMTFEALWMGVPVLTLTGNRHAGRWATSVLTRLGLTEFVADSPEKYLAAAVKLAGERERLARLRARLRDLLGSSPYCDGPAFTRKLEDAYRTMWRTWCAGAVSPASQPDTSHASVRHVGLGSPTCETVPVATADLFEQASRAHRERNFQQAEKLYQEVVQADANRADAWLMLGVSAYQLGRNERAIEALEKAVALDGANALLHSNLAEFYRTGKRHEEAIAAGRRAVLLRPDLPEAHNNLGLALMEQLACGTGILPVAAAGTGILPVTSAQNDQVLAPTEQSRREAAAACYREAIRLRPNYADAHNNLGNALQALGQLAEAEACYRQALRIEPGFIFALNNLGNVLKEKRQFDEAIGCYREALRLAPDYVEAHNHLGLVFLEKGTLPEAQESFQQALRYRPSYVEALTHLGVTHFLQQRTDTALDCFRKALSLQPDAVDTHYSLGFALMSAHQPAAAESSFRACLRIKPDMAQAHNNLGNVLKEQGRIDEALAAYEEALRYCPAFNAAHNNLGVLLMEMGRLAEATAHYEQALKNQPDCGLAHNNLGIILMEQGKGAEALAHYEEAVRANPSLAEAYNNLANNQKIGGRLTEAIESARKALELRPSFAEAHNSLGVAFQERGDLDEAMASYREALRLKKSYAGAHSNLLMCLNYAPTADLDEVFKEHCRWAQLHGQNADPFVPHANGPDPGRRLRIGYVSPDFRRHAVARLFEPILFHHDPERFETFCYAEVHAPDSTTARMQALAKGWHSTCGLSDAKLAQMIRADGIDILVDLAGHTAHNRLCVFARKPAPVQVTYLGYPNTTGLTAIDYRLTDAVQDPPSDPVRHTEELVRLPGGAWCFAPPAHSPAVNAVPALQTGRLTFGSLNNLAKVNEAVVDLWSRVLKAIPSARLLLFRHTLRGETRDNLQRQFTERGIPEQQLDLRSEHRGEGHHTAFLEIDVSLDVFPWTGHVTSIESLWMGVPVITLSGSRCAERLTASVLATLGLQELSAATPEQYVELAVRLSRNLERLTQLRAGLRGLVTAHLCNGQKFTRQLEETYRALWQKWCSQQ